MHPFLTGQILLSYILGIILGIFFPKYIFYIVFAILPITFFLEKKNVLFYLFLILFAILNVQTSFLSQNFFYENNTFVSIRGQLLQSIFPSHMLPENRKIKCILKIQEIFTEGHWLRCNEKVVMNLQCHIINNYHRGDYLEIRAVAQKIAGPRNPGEMNQQIYWKTWGISTSLLVSHEENIQLLAQSYGCPVLNFFSRMQENYSTYLLDVLGKDNGGIAVALFLGNKSFIGIEVWQSFLMSGTLHLLAISGFHVVIIAHILLKLLSCFLRNYFANLLFVIVLLICYSILTGMNVSVVRATFVLVLYLFAPIFGREKNALQVLQISAFILLVYNPYNLLSVGFQFSFLLCFCILWLQKNQAAFDENVNKNLWFSILDLLRISFIATLCVAPLTAYYFQTISPIAIVSGVLLYPWVYACLSGTLLLLFFPLSITIIGNGIIFIVSSIYEQFSFLVQLLSHMPYGYLQVSKPLLPCLFLFYIFVYFLRNHKYKLLIILPLCACVLFSGTIKNTMWQNKNYIVVFDIGHGDSFYINIEGKHYLYDCGNSKVSNFLLALGVRELDAIILSHHDTDHYQGIESVISKIRVQRVLCNFSFLTSGTKTINVLRSHNIPIQPIIDGETWRNFHFLYPGQYLLSNTEDNNHSLGVSFSINNKKVLLLGDMEDKALEQLMKKPKTIDLLQVPHHGSYNIYTQQLIDSWQPKKTFVSSKENFADSRILSLYSQNNISTWQTHISGAIYFYFTGTEIDVTTYK